MKPTRWPSDRCMPASLSRAISASNATVSRFTTWRFHWAISIAAWNEHCSMGRTNAPFITWKRWRGIPPWAMPRLIARRWKRWPTAVCRRALKPSGASPWNWNAWPITPATWERWPRTWDICRRLLFVGGCAVSFSMPPPYFAAAVWAGASSGLGASASTWTQRASTSFRGS